MSNKLNSLDEMHKYTDYITDYVNEISARAGDRRLAYLSELRGIPLESIKEAGIFYIGDATEMLIPKYFNYIEDFGVISPTNRKPIFHNRFVFPIKDTNGKVLNLVGYSNEADERYVYGTARYYRRRETMYGLENLNYAYDLGYAILTEGITDTLRVRSLGYKNTFANCGTHSSKFIMKQLNRCKNGVIKIPDRDAAGLRAAKKWNCNRGITLNVFIKYKDIDEMCKDSKDNIEWVKEYLDICIDWIKSSEHRGYSAQSQVVTMQ